MTDMLSISFSPTEKQAMIFVLNKHLEQTVAAELINTLYMPGETALTVTEALMLGGLVRPYYGFIADRILDHPAIMDGHAPTYDKARAKIEWLQESLEKWKERSWKYLWETIGNMNDIAHLKRENERLQADLERARDGMAEELIVRAKALIESGKGSVTVISTGTLEAIKEEARQKERNSLLRYLEGWAGEALNNTGRMRVLAKEMQAVAATLRAAK